MAAREFLKLTTETAYGVFPTSPATTIQSVIHLPAGNSFTPRRTPTTWTERSAGGSNRRVLRGTEQYGIRGKLSTKLFPSQCKNLIPYAINLAAIGGTSGAPWDIASFSAEHGIWLDDGSALVKNRYLGGKVDKMSLVANNTAAGTVCKLDLDLIFQSVATVTTAFTEPVHGTAPTYPTDDPWAFQDTRGLMTIGGVVRAAYSEISLAIDNKLRAPFDEGLTITALRWSGRDVSLATKFRYISVTDRGLYEAQTAQSIVLAFFDGTNTATFTLNSQNYPGTLADDLPFEGDGFYQMITYDNFIDTSLGASANDITFAQTP